MQAQVIIPDLALEGLSIKALIQLLHFIKPIGAQFDSGDTAKGFPFTVPSKRYPGAVEDTQIGGVVSGIGRWADLQRDRIVDAVRSTAPNGAIETEWRFDALLDEAITGSEWKTAREIIEFLEVRDGEAVIK